jgi:hypothetical protein
MRATITAVACDGAWPQPRSTGHACRAYDVSDGLLDSTARPCRGSGGARLRVIVVAGAQSYSHQSQIAVARRDERIVAIAIILRQLGAVRNPRKAQRVATPSTKTTSGGKKPLPTRREALRHEEADIDLADCAKEMVGHFGMGLVKAILSKIALAQPSYGHYPASRADNP